MLDRFAEQLKKARLKKGISLQQIAAKTRIDIKFLEAIDNGYFSFLPELRDKTNRCYFTAPLTAMKITTNMCLNLGYLSI